jgi:hypothetical protein
MQRQWSQVAVANLDGSYNDHQPKTWYRQDQTSDYDYQPNTWYRQGHHVEQVDRRPGLLPTPSSRPALLPTPDTRLALLPTPNTRLLAPRAFMENRYREQQYFTTPRFNNQVNNVRTTSDQTKLSYIPSRNYNYREKLVPSNITVQARIAKQKEPKKNLIQTSNTNFTNITKMLYRKCQVAHHSDIWQNLPKKLDSQVDLFFDSINPPNPLRAVGDLKTRLMKLKKETKLSIVNIVKEHLEKSLIETDAALGLYDEVDGDSAGYIVEKQLKRLGNKISPKFIFDNINRGLHLLKPTNQQPEQTYTHVITTVEQEPMEGILINVCPPSPPTTSTITNTEKEVSANTSEMESSSTTNNQFLTIDHHLAHKRRRSLLDSSTASNEEGLPRKVLKEDNRPISLPSLALIQEPLPTEDAGAASLIATEQPEAPPKDTPSIITSGSTESNNNPGSTEPEVPSTEGAFNIATKEQETPLSDTSALTTTKEPEELAIIPTEADETFETPPDNIEPQGSPEIPLTPGANFNFSSQNNLTNSTPGDSPHTSFTNNHEPPRNVRSSTPTTNIIPQFKMFESLGDKNNWNIKIRTDCTTLIIGDSNIRYFRDLPANWQAIGFPGLRFNERLAKLFEKPEGPQPLNIVVAVGINNRAENFRQVITRSIDEVTKSVQKNLPLSTLWTVGVSARQLNGLSMENISLINNRLKKIAGKHFIEPLPTKEIGLRKDNTPQQIHHDQVTADKVLLSIITSLNL